MINSGEIIIDVRSKAEFYTGHIETSLNIPLGDLSSKLDYLKINIKQLLLVVLLGSEVQGRRNYFRLKAALML